MDRIGERLNCFLHGMLSVLYSWQPSSEFSTNGTSCILSHHSQLFLLSSKSYEWSQTLWNGLPNTFAQQRCGFCLRKSGVHLPFNSSHSLPHLFIEVNQVRLAPKKQHSPQHSPSLYSTNDQILPSCILWSSFHQDRWPSQESSSSRGHKKRPWW